MEFGFIIGWVGLALGVCVPIPQLRRIIKTGSVGNVSLGTYIFLCCALVCYLLHAIHIGSVVFTVTQSINLATNTVILVLIIKRAKKSC